MKKFHAVFEILLISISCAIGLLVIINSEEIFLAASWMVILGSLQLIHSLIIAFSTPYNMRLRKALCIYWFLAGIDILLLFLISDSIDNLSLLTTFLFPVLPLCLALYLAGICWYFSEKRITQ